MQHQAKSCHFTFTSDLNKVWKQQTDHFVYTLQQNDVISDSLDCLNVGFCKHQRRDEIRTIDLCAIAPVGEILDLVKIKVRNSTQG